MKQLLKHWIVATLLLFSTCIYAQEKPKQCTALTVKHVQCKNRAVIGTEYCRLHSPDVPKCGAPTGKGTPCRNVVKEKGLHCWRHQYNN